MANLEFIDASRIIVAGTSAAGFASVAALEHIDDKVLGVISVNGGRCGKQGPQGGGAHHIASYYELISKKTTARFIF